MNQSKHETLRGFNYRLYYQGQLQNVSGNGDELSACCPFHDDTNPSFSANCKTGVYYCHGCCAKGNVIGFHMEKYNVQYEEAIEALSNIAESNYGQGVVQSTSEDDAAQDCHEPKKTCYDYHGPDGEYAFSVLRVEEPGKRKEFRQGRYDEELSRWIYNVKELKKYPYRLPDLLNAETVYIVEGEKDADNLARLGLAATCNPGGAMRWKPEYGPYFKGKHVVILPDNDEPGRKHALDVHEKLSGNAATVRVVLLPNLPVKGDVSDWLQAGGTVEELQRIVEGAPVQTPPPPPFSFTTLDLASLQAGRFLMSEPKPPRWTLVGSLLQGSLGLVVSNGGVGKSWFLLQLAMSVATNLDCLDGLFEIGERGKVLAIFAEDTEDVIHSRIRAICRSFSASMRYGVASRKQLVTECSENLFILSGVGIDFRLQEEKRGAISKTQMYEEMRNRISGISGLKLIILDPASRFYGTNENDNSQATHFCALLENICRDTGATIVMAHHTNKYATNPKDSSYNTLSQGASRGASGFTNAARWQLNFTTLKEKEVIDVGGVSGEYYKYLSGAVVKKNIGKPEPKFLMVRAEGGVLRRHIDQSRSSSDAIEFRDRVLNLVAETVREGKEITRVGFVKQYSSQLGVAQTKVKKSIDELLEAKRLVILTKRNARGLETNYLSVDRKQK